MNKITTSLLAVSVIINIVLFSKLFSITTTEDTFTVQKKNKTLGVIHKAECPGTITTSKICSVELVEVRPDFAMVKIHYHYKKGIEDKARMVVKANNGSHDNTVGTNSAHHLMEGSNTIQIPFGLYNVAHKKASPYESSYIVVRAQGISKDGKRYITPHVLENYIPYKKTWYVEGDKVSWKY